MIASTKNTFNSLSFTACFCSFLIIHVGCEHYHDIRKLHDGTGEMIKVSKAKWMSERFFCITVADSLAPSRAFHNLSKNYKAYVYTEDAWGVLAGHGKPEWDGEGRYLGRS